MKESLPQAVPLPGETLAGKYRIERILGVGGMGLVVSARHLVLEERVAIKFLHGKRAPALHERFLREARAVMKIRSEHVARVLDVGSLEDGSPYTVFEYLEGEDLEAKCARGPMPVRDAVDSILQACDAVAEAHSIGIVHRDLKPANLFWTERADGSLCIKVLDFGIAKVKGATTTASGLMGSPLYMAPEQFEGNSDPRSDVWSLGACLYQLVTGCTPFIGESLPQLYDAVSKQEPVPIKDVLPSAPPELVTAIDRCLKKKPEDRFQSVAELVQTLEPIASTEVGVLSARISRIAAGKQRSTSIPSGPEISSAPSSHTLREFATTIHPRKTRGWMFIASALALVSIGIIGLQFRSSPSDAPQGQSSTLPSRAAATVAPVESASQVTAPPPPPPIAVSTTAPPAMTTHAPTIRPAITSVPHVEPSASTLPPAPTVPPTPSESAAPRTDIFRRH